jgi:hypothetical protein
MYNNRNLYPAILPVLFEEKLKKLKRYLKLFVSDLAHHLLKGFPKCRVLVLEVSELNFLS